MPPNPGVLIPSALHLLPVIVEYRTAPQNWLGIAQGKRMQAQQHRTLQGKANLWTAVL